MDSTTTYIGLSQQMALRRQMDLIASNLANMSTTAYRRENVVFQSFLEKGDTGDTTGLGRVNYVLDFGIARDTTPGALILTSNPLDVALDKPGFFTVAKDDGTQAYTRNGRFQLSDDGTLVTATGDAVLSTQGQPIRIPQGEFDVSIGPDGTVRTNAGDKGQIGLVRFADERTLKRTGDGYYEGEGANPIPAGEISMKPNMLEGSNIQPILETTEMIDVLRSYQSTTRMLERYDEMRSKGLERLGRVQ
jgi:flagellar basal-body rod protein FlgF